MAEVDGPDPIIDFLEAEDVLLERVRDEEQTVVEPDGPRVRHPLGNVMARILDRRKATRVPARRRLVERGGRPASEKLVRALVVVEDAKSVEGALLAGRCACGGRAVAALSVRCIRSWAPFCWGLAGRIR